MNKEARAANTSHQPAQVHFLSSRVWRREALDRYGLSNKMGIQVDKIHFEEQIPSHEAILIKKAILIKMVEQKEIEVRFSISIWKNTPVAPRLLGDGCEPGMQITAAHLLF